MKTTEWAAKEVKLLRKSAGKKTPNRIAELLDRSPNAVRLRASKLGLSLATPGNERMSGLMRKADLDRMQKTTKRTRKGRKSTAGRNKRGTATNRNQSSKGRKSSAGKPTAGQSKGGAKLRILWTKAAEEQLRKLAGTMPAEEIARQLNRTPKAIQRKAAKMNGLSLAVKTAAAAPSSTTSKANGTTKSTDKAAAVKAPTAKKAPAKKAAGSSKKSSSSKPRATRPARGMNQPRITIGMAEIFAEAASMAKELQGKGQIVGPIRTLLAAEDKLIGAASR